jgi:hypothetical protein
MSNSPRRPAAHGSAGRLRAALRFIFAFFARHAFSSSEDSYHSSTL